MNKYLKAIVVFESILIVAFVLKVTGIFEGYILEEYKGVVGSTAVMQQVSENDLFQNLSTQDPTVETEDEAEPKSKAELKNQNVVVEKEPVVDGKIDNSEVLKLLKRDPELKLLTYRSKSFHQSPTKYYLQNKKKTRFYVLVELDKPLDFELLYKLKNEKINKIFQLSLYDYLGRKEIFLYLNYYKLNRLAKMSNIKKVHILTDYTALGYYQLGMRAEQPIRKLHFDLRYPYSKPGHQILKLENQFSKISLNEYLGDFEENQLENENIVSFDVRLDKDETIYFMSKIKAKISFEQMMEHNIHIAGKTLTLPAYKEQVQSADPELYQKYTQFTEKVVSSGYIKNIVNQFYQHDEKQKQSGLTEKSISGIWRQLTFILNRDIRYDWNKRKLFFSGNLPYNNIRNMYKTAKELAESRVGACTERTSLEIAVLRELGVAARTATRLYHIFTEIYLPHQGWVSTSTTLNEIPLCHSVDEKMAYFIQWEPDHPIRLKWSGFLLPQVVTESTTEKLALGKLIK